MPVKLPIQTVSTLVFTMIWLTACRGIRDNSAGLSPSDLGSTRNVHRIGDIYFSGQPGPDDWDAVTRAGIKTVITLRHVDELKEFDEKETVAALGMEFIQIPFGSAGELTDTVIEEVRARLKSARQPLLLHCASANRVGAVWIPFRVLDRGVAYDKALEEAKTIGLRSEAYQQRVEAYLEGNGSRQD